MNDIVVGVDGSAPSDLAVARAAEEARSTGARLRVVHAWTTPVWMGGIPGFAYNVLASPEESRRFANELLQRQVEAFQVARRDLPVDMVAEAVQGPVRQVLPSVARDAALLVVGSRGEGRVHGLLLGSVAQYLLSHAPCPLMLVPDAEPAVTTTAKVVVGADGSASSRAAMRWALGTAERHGSPLVVVHAWHLGSLPGRPPLHGVPSLREYETECREWLDKEVQEVLPEHEGVVVRTELAYGSATWGLRDAAGPDDLLVVGRRGRGGFPGMLLGSVASQCAHYARGPVVVVPPVTA
jgi:nucleotide-binding universal stress UspA family protein